MKERLPGYTKRELLKLGVGLAAFATLEVIANEPIGRALGYMIDKLQPQPEADRKESLEIKQVYQYSIDFDIGNDHYNWNFTNASFGIYPPNDPNRVIGTIRVWVNNVRRTPFQPLGSLYPETQALATIAIGGMAVDVPLDKYYLGTATIRPLSNTWDPHLELGNGIATAENYTGRQRLDKGLPTGGFSGAFTEYVTLGRDDRGNWLNMMFIGCDIPLQDGTYQIRRDNLGNIIGDTFIKLSNSIVPDKPYQVFLPIILR